MRGQVRSCAAPWNNNSFKYLSLLSNYFVVQFTLLNIDVAITWLVSMIVTAKLGIL